MNRWKKSGEGTHRAKRSDLGDGAARESVADGRVGGLRDDAAGEGVSDGRVGLGDSAAREGVSDGGVGLSIGGGGGRVEGELDGGHGVERRWKVG